MTAGVGCAPRWARLECCGGSEIMAVNLLIETEQEEDGRWIAEIPDLAGVMVYGNSRDEAVSRVKALALRALADRLENGEAIPQTADLFSVVP
jgi:predicted RNase H-like HicB family nuclease